LPRYRRVCVEIRSGDDSDRGTAADRRTGQAYGRLARGPACVAAALRDHRAAALPGGEHACTPSATRSGFTRCRPTWPMVCLLHRQRGPRWPTRPLEAAGPAQERRTARLPRNSTRPPGRSGARWHGSTPSWLSKRSTDSSRPSPSRRSPPRCCCPTSRMSGPAGNAERRRAPRNIASGTAPGASSREGVRQQAPRPANAEISAHGAIGAPHGGRKRRATVLAARRRFSCWLGLLH
jgi:hypothetical protein